MDREKALRRFGANVRRLRKLKGLSQEELAAMARCHRNYLGGVERGERNITLTKVLDLANAIGCPVHHLFQGLQSQSTDKR